MNELRHRVDHVNGIRIHSVEAGSGPLVLLVHGFPESWYSWRHQLPALAEAGYRAVAIDVRGYGRSSKPAAVDAYRMHEHVNDNVELVHALGEERAVVVGHDWGAPIAWTSAWTRPDVFRAVAGFSVPFSPPGPTRPLAALRAMAGDEEFYIEYFQEPGRAEAEIEEGVRGWLLGFYFTSSGDAASIRGIGPMSMIASGARMRDRFRYPDTMPSWMNEADLDVYVGEFERSGFVGALHRYRNIDHDWEDTLAIRDTPIEVPSLFLYGEKDGPAIWGAKAIGRFGTTLPQLHRSVMFPGCGHWVQQERAAETSEALVDFLHALDG